jgi:hypothetical protein
MCRSSIILVIFFLVHCTSVPATKYYVSSTGGNDSWDGKSEASPWATLSKISGSSFRSGDSIFFKAGDIWRETLEVPSSGDASGNLYFGRYGSGKNPGILGSSATTTWTGQGGNIWKTDNTFKSPRSLYPNYSDIVFINKDGSRRFGTYKSGTTGLTGEFDWTWSSNYIYVYSAEDPGVRYSGVEVQQRQFCVSTNDHSYLHFNGVDALYSANAGYDSNNDHTVSNQRGCIIENSEIGFIGGVTGQQYGFGIAMSYSDLTIRQNEIHHCGRRGISVNMEYTSSPWTVENILIEKNTFHGGSHTTSLDMTVNNGGSSCSISGVIFRYNLVYEEQGLTVPYPSVQMWYQCYSGSGTIDNVYIYSNIFKYWRENCIATESRTLKNVYIYNNTFYEHNTAPSRLGYTYGIYSDSDNSNLKINVRNNIFYSTLSNDSNGNGSFVTLYGISTSHYSCDYNLYYRLSNSLRILLVNGTGYYMNTISSLRSATGWEINSPLPSNPLFVSSADLHLQAGSPAIGKGTLLPIASDYEGKPLSNPCDIGSLAFLLTGNTCPVITITSPVKSSSYSAPADITINAVASDADGSIAKVAFFNGMTKLGETSSYPYSFVWKSVPAGTYSLVAVTTDNRNTTGVSAPVSFTVSVVTALEPGRPGKENEDKLLLFPNPNSGRFSIGLEGSGEDEYKRMTIFDLSGKVVYKEILQSGETTRQIDVSQYPSGTYIIRVDGDIHSASKKFLKN